MPWVDLLARLVPQPPAFRHVLAAAQDIPRQALATVQAGLPGGLLGDLGVRPARPAQAGLDEGPAPADPVAVAAVDELVGAAREAALGGVLARRQPRDEAGDVDVSASPVSTTSTNTMICSMLPSACRACAARTYLGMLRCGESIMDRQPRAQKAYAPWASRPGLADTPPSYVWPACLGCGVSLPACRRLMPGPGEGVCACVCMWCVREGGKTHCVRSIRRDRQRDWCARRHMQANPWAGRAGC